MTLYGYSREPDSHGDDSPPGGPQQQRISSQPVSVPGASTPMTSDDPANARGEAPVETWTDVLDAGAIGPVPTTLPEEMPSRTMPSQTLPPSADVGSLAAAPEQAPAAARPSTLVPDSLADWGPDDEVDEVEVMPWDRRPLMIVLAGVAAMVLLAVLSGVAAAALLGPRGDPVGWRAAQAQPAATPSGGPAGPAVPADTITLSGVGDVIMGTQPGDIPPSGGKGFFEPVKGALASDLVMGNLETPLTVNTGRVKCGTITPSPSPGNPSPKPTKAPGCHQFYLPPSYANHLRDAGFQVMNLANNHTHDMGADGLRNTRTSLDAAGIKHTGAPNQITYVEVKGVRVAVLGFGIYSWGQSLNNIPAAQALVRKADVDADLVVIQMQGGAEGADKSHVRPGHEIFLGEDRGDLIKFTHAVIDAGADVVFGHGPHIMRGMEFYKGRLIAYSLGNFCGYGVLSSAGYLGVGGVLKVTLHRDGTWAAGQLVPTEMVKGGMVAVDADKRALTFVDGLSRSDFGANAARISKADGAITPPTSS